MTNIKRGSITLTCVAMLVAVASAGSAQVDTGALIRQIRSAELREGAPVQVNGFKFQAGLAKITLDHGVLYPATAIGDRPVELVFVGEGSIRVEPPDDVEAGQLELFTGSATLDERFTDAVFVMAIDRAADILLARPPAAAGPPGARDAAAARLDAWHSSAEYKLLDIEARVFMDAVGDPLSAAFFAAFLVGEELGEFLYVADPLSDEQVTIGQFVVTELTEREHRTARRELHRAQRKGKLIGIEVSDLGVWDTWVSTHLKSAAGKPTPGTRGVEPVRYAIDATLTGSALAMEAVARIEMRTLVQGLRTVSLDMDQDLALEEVNDGDGNELPFLRSSHELVVVLPAPAEKSSTLAVEVSYTCNPIEKAATKAYVQRDTMGWYPHAGLIDRAAYDVTLRWPRKLDLAGSGVVVDGGLADDGLQWQRRVLDTPSLGFSFEVGDYEVVEERVGHVDVRVAIDRLGHKISKDLEEDILDTVSDSLTYFEEVFGPYPLDHLEVVTSPRLMSQGLLGFVSLSTAATLDWEGLGALLGFTDRRTVIAHEVAHQWWGNVVGWKGYRDQWLSEAMANLAALLYARNRLDSDDAEPVWAGPTSGWQTSLLASTEDGLPIETLGPVVLGSRLVSSIGDAYEPIVYKKGAVILDMLARTYSEETFVQMLQAVVRAASLKAISTDDFINMIEELSGTDLSWFARQYVYGTGLPEIYYSYELQGGEQNGWLVVGETRQNAPYHYQYRVEQLADGSFDVARDSVSRLDVSDSVLVVPFQIGLTDDGPGDAGGRRGDPAADRKRRILNGRMLVRGESSPFRFEIEHEPEILWLDREGEVFGRFFCETRWPRRIGFFEALDLAAQDRSNEAVEALERALQAPVADFPEGWGLERDLEDEGRRLDIAIHLELARLHLDSAQVPAAEAAFGAAREKMRRRDRWRFEEEMLVLEARTDLRHGAPDRAYRALRGRLHGRDALDSAEGLALFAIAAHATGHQEAYETALERARVNGVDVAALEAAR